MLVIVNPYATTVSDRLKNLVVYALRGRYEVEAIDTTDRGHASALAREAAHEGYDVVVAFGGDGTVNEAANGLVGSPTPLTCLPGGATNVYTRLLGIPSEIVDATEHLLRVADDWRPRRVDLGALAGAVLTRAHPLDMPTVIWRAFSKRAELTRHRRIEAFGPLAGFTVRSADGRPLPLQVDGDHIADVEVAEYSVRPGALTV